jgi:hypothetical protein
MAFFSGLGASNTTAEQAHLLAIRNETVLAKTWVIGTNISLLLYVVVALRRGRLFGPILVIMGFLQSVAYHICQTLAMCFGSSYEEQQGLDHVTATILVSVALYDLLVPPRLVAISNLAAFLRGGGEGAENTARERMHRFHSNFFMATFPAYLVIVIMAVMTHPRDVFPVYIASFLAIPILLVRFLLFAPAVRNFDFDLGIELPFNLWYLLAALASAAVGVISFLVEFHYAIFHGLWHTFAGPFLTFWLLAFDTSMSVEDEAPISQESLFEEVELEEMRREGETESPKTFLRGEPLSRSELFGMSL